MVFSIIVRAKYSHYLYKYDAFAYPRLKHKKKGYFLGMTDVKF